jgi:hypothetical protein
VSQLKQVAATGDVATGADGYRVFSVTVSAAADAASCVIRDVSSGSALLTVKAPIQTTATWHAGDPDGVWIGTTIHATVTGTSPAVSIEYA